jgi:hypothetical protein
VQHGVEIDPSLEHTDVSQDESRPRLKARTVISLADLREATKVIVKYHYLHRGRTMAQLAYWISVDGFRAGVVLFAYPRLSVSFHGYGPMELIELARLWVDPSLQGGVTADRRGRLHTVSIASCSIAMALRRVGTDWTYKYPSLPIPRAVVSWADLSRHEGTVYRAANFADLGLSGGKGHGVGRRSTGGEYKDHPDYRNPKRAFMYVLRQSQNSSAYSPAGVETAPLPRQMTLDLSRNARPPIATPLRPAGRLGPHRCTKG